MHKFCNLSEEKATHCERQRRHSLKKWLWPATIALSALAAGLVNSILPHLVGRPIIVLWFLCVCPGMTIIRFLQLQEPVTEWTLAIALSLVIDAAVAGIQLYLGYWSPPLTLTILINLCIVGVIMQIAKKVVQHLHPH
jgi:hypothetical protein